MTEAEYDGPRLVWSRDSRFKRERFHEITPSRQPARIKGALPRLGVAFLAGASQAAKTFVGLDACCRLAAGATKVWGRKAAPCGVAWIGAEDPDGCRTRLAAWRFRYRRTSPPMPFEFLGQALNLLDDNDVDELRGTLQEVAADMAADGHELGIVCFDTWSACLPGVEENGSADMSRALSVLQALSQELRVLILVIAHFGKSGADKGVRGWSGIGANADAVVTLERDAEDPELRIMTFSKVKNGAKAGGRVNFRLEEVELDQLDDDGDPITSCVPAYEVAAPENPAAKKRRKRALNAPETIVLQSIRYVTDNGRTLPLPPTVQGGKPWQKAVTWDDVRARALTSGLSEEGDKPNSVTVRFRRSVEGVIASGAARMEGKLLWLV